MFGPGSACAGNPNGIHTWRITRVGGIRTVYFLTQVSVIVCIIKNTFGKRARDQVIGRDTANGDGNVLPGFRTDLQIFVLKSAI